MSAMEIFELVNEADCYPSIYIAHQILFTMPVTVASAEKSFSKLKLLNNYLRSTISQERLNGLATLCIEKELLDKLILILGTNAFLPLVGTTPRVLPLLFGYAQFCPIFVLEVIRVPFDHLTNTLKIHKKFI